MAPTLAALGGVGIGTHRLWHGELAYLWKSLVFGQDSWHCLMAPQWPERGQSCVTSPGKREGCAGDILISSASHPVLPQVLEHRRRQQKRQLNMVSHHLWAHTGLTAPLGRLCPLPGLGGGLLLSHL